MDFAMDLQLFGGGGESSSTSRDIPAQTPNEKALEDFLLNSASLAGNMSPLAYQAFAGSLENTYTPNWNDLFGEYVNRSDNAQKGYTDYAVKAMDDYANVTNTYWDLMNNSRGDLQNKAGNYLGQYEDSMGKAKSAYDAAVGKRASAWDDLVNGVLPSQYAANRQAALNADLKGTMGSAINNLASRGVINSGVGNKAMDDISQSASDTLAKRYADDLQLEASLLGQDRANAKTDYDVASGHAGNLYGNQMGNAQSIYQTNADTYNNVMNQYADLYKTRTGAADNWIQNVNATNSNLWNGAISGQSASFEPATNFLNYASQLQQPVSNLYNTMYSGRMGTGSTTTTTSDGGGGLWSAVGGLGSAAIIACFTGDTLVTTPDGYKAIKDIAVGDTVLSVQAGEIVPKKVASVTGGQDSLVVDVLFENGTVWHTTATQRYYDGKHFSYLGNRYIPAMVFNGEPSLVARVDFTGRHDTVYDITLEGFAGENIFFANDVAAEGLGE